jgi:glycosyltransferase involved in cell wall biosynthesis
MRLVIYTHVFAPKVGGTQMVVQALAAGLAGKSANGIGVTVVTKQPPGGLDDRCFPFLVVRRPGLFTLFRLLRAADVVHLAGPALLPLALCVLLRKPVVIEHHGYQAVCPNGLLLYEPTKTACPGHFMAGRHGECIRCNAGQGRLRSFRMWLRTFPRRGLARRAPSNVAVTTHVAERLRLPRSRVIYHGTADRQRSQAGSGGTGAPPDEICFGYAGRLVSEKGLALLVEAAARLRAEGSAFRLKFVGEGPERARLEEQARARGLADRTVVTGMLSGEALELAVADIAALVMPSIWEETAGLAAMEQMMRGRLVIAADIGGLGEVVADAGLKFPPGDLDALCACLRQVLDRPEIVREYGAKARARALEFFQTERMVEEHRRLYRELCSPKT